MCLMRRGEQREKKRRGVEPRGEEGEEEEGTHASSAVRALWAF